VELVESFKSTAQVIMGEKTSTNLMDWTQ